MEEIWKEVTWIDNLRGSYEVSNLGNVRRTSLIRFDTWTNQYTTVHKTRLLKQYDNGHGYKHVTFCINTESGKKLKICYVHRLVAIAFIENPNNYPEVNHKNFVREDNRVTNLEWVSSLDNMRHSATMDSRLKPKYPQPHSKKRKNNVLLAQEKGEFIAENQTCESHCITERGGISTQKGG